MKVIKANGELEVFDKNKIKRTVLKAGGSEDFAKKIASRIEKESHDGITTNEILKKILRLLKDKPLIALKYNLKRAIMSLGPTGFTFEEYFSQILQNYGYNTKVDLTLKGKAITQEVDILAEKNKTFMIECKYHNKIGIHTDSKVAMYTYARFLDLKNNPKNKIDQGWLVTNTKCTSHAIKYAKAVNLKITSWKYASKNEKNLQELIREKKLYPITILHSVKGKIRQKLVESKIVLVKSIINYDIISLRQKTGLSKKELNTLINEANKVMD